MAKTNIQWAAKQNEDGSLTQGETWNPVTGCSKVSPGCAHCYAEQISLRYRFSSVPWTPQNAAQNVVLHEDRLNIPAKRRKPTTFFVNSMSDLFHEQVPSWFINEVWMTMFNNPRHTYQVLTKRPERLLWWTQGKARVTSWPIEDIWPSWIWLGTSVENQHWANIRIPLLLQTPAKVRFLSCEPLLGSLDLRAIPYQDHRVDSLTVGIHWVIAGGESGLKHRPMKDEWAISLRDQCQATGTAFFFKQWGGRTPKSGGDLLDGKQWHQMPGGVE